MSEPSAAPKNYITPSGYAQLQREWSQLMDVERPEVVTAVHWAAKNGDRSENGDYIYGKRRLREIDRRIRFLTKRLELAVVVDSKVHQGSEHIFFGARVTYVKNDGTEHTVRIMGVDEADSLSGDISWVSPMARALIKRSVGDVVHLHTPAGAQTVEIVAVAYDS